MALAASNCWRTVHNFDHWRKFADWAIEFDRTSFYRDDFNADDWDWLAFHHQWTGSQTASCSSAIPWYCIRSVSSLTDTGSCATVVVKWRKVSRHSWTLP